MSETALELNRVAAGYRGKNCIQDITFSLPAGQSLGIIGVNGAGKTTLIKAIIGVNLPAEGSIQTFGKDVSQAEARKTFAFLPERFIPSPLLTGYEVLRLARYAYGLEFDRAGADKAALSLNLPADILPRRVKTYSKGTAQKLGLASMLYCERKMLILDEPFSGLDPIARQHLRQALSAYRNEGGSLVFTSHLLEDVPLLADYILMLDRGRKKFLGSLQEICSKPAWKTWMPPFWRFRPAQSRPNQLFTTIQLWLRLL